MFRDGDDDDEDDDEGASAFFLAKNGRPLSEEPPGGETLARSARARSRCSRSWRCLSARRSCSLRFLARAMASRSSFAHSSRSRSSLPCAVTRDD